MPLNYFGKQVIHVAVLIFIQLQYDVPLSSTSKSLPIHSNLTLHICYIMFEEKFADTFKVMGRIKYSCNFSILKPEERCLFRNIYYTEDDLKAFII